MEIGTGYYHCYKEVGKTHRRVVFYVDRATAAEIAKLGIASGAYSELTRLVCPVVNCPAGSLRAGIKADSLGSIPQDGE